MKRISIFCIGLMGLMLSCQKQPKTLPIYGPKEFIQGIDKDTIYHTIPKWSLTNQDGQTVGFTDFQDKIYVAHFFFTHCPSICVKMIHNMKTLQAQLPKGVMLLSHTVDPTHDDVKRLKKYCEINNLLTYNWHLVTGEKNDIYTLGLDGYLVPNQEDARAEGGFLHSEKFILIDTKGRIRGYYNGTDSLEIPRIVADVKTLSQK